MPRKQKFCVDCSTPCRPKAQTDYPRCRKCLVKHNSSNKPTRKEYSRNWHLYKKYKITSDEFDTLFVVFRGRCSICDVVLTYPTQTRGQPPTTAVLDHDHHTGNIRGILCNSCNKGIGLLKDSPEILTKALEYLKNE